MVQIWKANVPWNSEVLIASGDFSWSQNVAIQMLCESWCLLVLLQSHVNVLRTVSTCGTSCDERKIPGCVFDMGKNYKVSKALGRWQSGRVHMSEQFFFFSKSLMTVNTVCSGINDLEFV